MSDDIVTRLRELITDLKKTVPQTLMIEAADEIERLREAIIKIEKAITDEGKMPSYHRQVVKRHRQEWKTLHNAIDEAIKAVHHD